MSLSLLFVDDEMNVLRGLKRMLYSERSRLKAHFADNGSQALSVLGKESIQVIVSDMHMPGMDGATLLTSVQKDFPEVIRVVLSGHSEPELILKAIRPAHRFLHKPIGKETILDMASWCQLLLRLSLPDDVRRAVTGLDILPGQTLSFPLVMQHLQDGQRSGSISEALTFDAALTANVYKVVMNSFVSEVGSLPPPARAVESLGSGFLQQLFTSKLGFSDCFGSSPQDFSVIDLWRHSLRTARYAKAISEQETNDQDTATTAFLAGLFHDIGKFLFLDSFENRFQKALETIRSHGQTWERTEYEQFGVSHSEVGAFLMGLWGQPAQVIEALAFHHQPARLKKNRFEPLTAVHAANVFDHALLCLRSGHPQRRLDQEHLERTGLKERVQTWKKVCLDLFKEDIRQQEDIIL